MTKIVIITGPALRHKYFVNTLGKYYEVVGVVSEEKRPNQDSEDKEESDLLQEHFFFRNQAENKYFEPNQEFNGNYEILKVSYGETNSLAVFEWVKKKEAEYIILFGSSIIKPPLLEFYNGKIINIHLGLSPYYRGSGTNFWPLVNNEPECVGATIHLAILKVDAGSILAQARPENLTLNDNSHDIGCKAIIAGTKKMAECIEKYKKKEIIPKQQIISRGSVYKRSDFSANAVRIMQENFRNGMILNYLKHKFERDALFPIIEL